MRTIVNAQNQMGAGNLWRAKEILQSSIPNAGYDHDLFEKLGQVLLAMADLPEAGRFLFLAGRSKPEYEQAIEIYLRKHRKDWHDLFQSFPRVARLSKRSEYPMSVASHLADLGSPEVIKREVTKTLAHSSGVISSLIGWLIVGSVALVIVLGILKLIELVRLIF